jgi:hypothetical protein
LRNPRLPGSDADSCVSVRAIEGVLCQLEAEPECRRNVVRTYELIRNSNSAPAIRRTDISRWSKNPAIGAIEYGHPVVESSPTPAMKLFQQYADDRSSE